MTSTTLATFKISSAAPEIQELYQLALSTRTKSHSPYSGYKVGAAIRASNGKTYGGCNVENSSFGATACAEQVAIQKAVSEQGPLQILAVMVVTDSNPPWTPCGICRQVISEFGKAITIYTANTNGDFQIHTLNDILPHAFTSAEMNA
jgi:cytidine deaminase